MPRKKSLDMELWRHQQQLNEAPWQRPDINYFFLIGGYGCGKTSGDVFFLFNVIQRYYKTPITIGVFGITITLLRKTLIGEFEKYLILTGTKFTDDKNSNSITVGRVTIHLIALEQPQLIYAYNLNISLVDELDELPADKCMAAFTAIQERTRITLPDGREAFSVFTTTAQGYSGAYAIVESLRDSRQKFVLIRGQTKDNLALSRAYVDRLYALYDDNERLAYLEGYFVNLNTGKVYGDYNPDVNLGKTNLDVKDIHIVQIGQDFNAGFSKGVALVKADDHKLHAVKTFSFKQIQHAPTIIRNAFPNNEIFWYPDASSKEIFAGYVKEVKEKDINVRISSVNPPIVERIMFVNKMFKTQRLIVDPICRDLDIALKTRQFDDTGKPEKGRGENATDHVCVTGDTLIATDKGQVPIRDIHVGDYVLTRQGYKKVVSAQCTGIADVAPVYGVKATSDHPFYTDRGFVHAGKLSIWDTPYTMTQKEIRVCQMWNVIQSSLMELSTDAILTRKTVAIGTTMCLVKTLAEKTTDSIGLSGLKRTGLYLKAFMSIIKTVIGSTILWRTSNSSKDTCTYHDILENAQQRIQNGIKQVLKRPAKRQKLGTLVMRAMRGMYNTLSKATLYLSMRLNANGAERPLSERRGLSTALEYVCLKPAERLASMMSRAIVCGVETRSLRINTRRPFAVAQVTPLTIEHNAAVYNITVEDVHEYFANGTLTSNCDALEYSCWRIALGDHDFSDLWALSRSAHNGTLRDTA